MTTSRIPYLPMVVSVSLLVLFGFAVVSGYVLAYTDDDVTKGNIIGTWQNFSLLVVGFWIGSSSGGKAKDEPTGEPVDVNVKNKPGEPIPTEETNQ